MDESLRTGASPSGRVDETVDNASALSTASPTLSRLSPTSSTGPTTSDPENRKLKFLRISTPVTGDGYDHPEGTTSQSRYTLLRPSGCPDNPDHLTTQVRKLATSLQTGPFGSQLHADDYVTDGVPVINPANLVGGRLVPDEHCTIDDLDAARLEHHKVFGGDILFARRGEVGRCGLVGDEQEGWLCGTGCLRMEPRSSSVDSAFLLHLFSTTGIRSWLELESVGSTMQNLTRKSREERTVWPRNRL